MNFFLMFAFIAMFFNSGRQKEIIATYSAISCPCAQWKVNGEKENVYLERANTKLQDVNVLWDGQTLPFKVLVKGEFKNAKGIPRGFTVKGEPKPAKIFVYSEFKLLRK